MLEDLPYKRFRLLSASVCLAHAPPSINHCLTDLLSLQTTPTSPKGTPRVAQSDSHYAEPEVRFPFTRTVRVVSGAHSTACRQMLHLLFHSEYTHGAESRHAVNASHAPPVKDWLVAVVTTSRQAQ